MIKLKNNIKLSKDYDIAKQLADRQYHLENNYNQNRDYMVEFPELYQIVQRASQEEKLRHLSHSPSSSTFGANEALYYKMAQDENDPNEN